MAYHTSGGYSGDERDARDGDDRPGGSVDLSNKPTYLMEHLATFTVTKDTGIVYPADGMRRLLQLEKTNGIWSQKMQLCLDRSWVLIMDYETGSVMERFPASLIQEPTAFTSLDPMEMYNNILVFIVGGSDNGQTANMRSEMHIFQCQSISAQDLVEDLKLLQMGKVVTHHRSNMAPTSAKNVTDSRSREQGSAYGAYRDPDSDLSGLQDETSSTSSEKYERDVTILNHCFDDIEKFIARLQHAAAASRELERRRRNRKSRKRDIGDGMLTMRTKPPPEIEFVDIFQKFKLSFNLLAKLKAHIHDPNAPELVHFLFTPLALIVDASHDTYYDHNLPSKVVTPLLSREAVNLLINCVSSKETELWQSLGEAWLIPRDHWKGPVAPYHPVFMDGWSPDCPVLDEHETSDKRHDSHFVGSNYDYDTSAVGQEGNKYSDEERDRMKPVGNEHFNTLSDISVDSIERNGQQRSMAGVDKTQELWADDLQARGAKVVQVTYPRTANNDKELTVVRGEFLEILDDSRKWWKARNIRGQVAHVPHTIVTPHNCDDNFQRQDSGRSSIGVSEGPSGPIQSPSSVDWIRNQHQVNGDEQRIKPPPPPPLPVEEPESRPESPDRSPATQNIINPKKVGGGLDADEDVQNVQDELKFVLTLFREKRKLNITKTPDIYIEQTSTPGEVQAWLKAKGFSQHVRSKMVGLTGEDLFLLPRDKLEEFCGDEEGKRLASQITVQRSVNKFKTARSSELQRILALARQKAEEDEEV
uniref:Putative epidermal growth factor receptor kinase substrate n=1 Tax=Xenopsylla cheopis TaxID=163159 RepID=A0A6M2DQI0_XENCH